jgi:hypothetical protein
LYACEESDGCPAKIFVEERVIVVGVDVGVVSHRVVVACWDEVTLLVF